MLLLRPRGTGPNSSKPAECTQTPIVLELLQHVSILVTLACAGPRQRWRRRRNLVSQGKPPLHPGPSGGRKPPRSGGLQDGDLDEKELSPVAQAAQSDHPGWRGRVRCSVLTIVAQTVKPYWGPGRGPMNTLYATCFSMIRQDSATYGTHNNRVQYSIFADECTSAAQIPRSTSTTPDRSR